MVAQPPFAALDLGQRVGAGRFAVESDEARAPVALERFLDDRLRLRRAAEREMIASGGLPHGGGRAARPPAGLSLWGGGPWQARPGGANFPAGRPPPAGGVLRGGP